MFGWQTSTRGVLKVVLASGLSVYVLLLSVGSNVCSFLRAREDVLRDDLFVMRAAIDQYTMDKQRPPRSLQDLVDANYLKALPKNPISRSVDWEPVFEDFPSSGDPRPLALVDIHSGSHNKANDGSTYNTW